MTGAPESVCGSPTNREIDLSDYIAESAMPLRF